MLYCERQTSLTFFEDWEEEAIANWLNARGLRFDFPTVCGSCCGYYEQEFWVDLDPTSVEEFNAFARDRKIGALAYSGGIRIGDPQYGTVHAG